MDPLAPDFANTPVSPERPHFHYILRDKSESMVPVVSIITPYYNTGEVFLETARSLWQQSLQQWEWLIVNDGSDEPEALRVLDAFREKDPRIRVIDLDANQGLPAARNAGVREVRAEFVFFLDADDLIEPTALEKMTWCLESYPEFGFCKGFTVGFGAEEYLSAVGFEARRLFLWKNPVTPRSMVRREVVLSVGGFDESLIHGLEDWDFWLRCAAQGFWGHTIPEYLDWFRRRRDHSDRWAAWTKRGVKEMRRELRRRYPELYAKGIPLITPRPLEPYGDVQDDVPFINLLAKQQKRLLLIIPWMAMGGADKVNLDLITQLRRRGYEISVVTTLPVNYQWYREFANLTPDIFILPNFLRLNDYPRFLRYFIQSRQIDVVLISNSELGYKLLPYLRSRCPDTAFVDYCHIEEEYWNNGGHPRSSVGYQELLDLSMVVSNHLKEWMVQRGAKPDQVEVCYVNVDTESFSPDQEVRLSVRSELKIPPDIPVILYAGRLCQQKQPRVFAKVMRELKARGFKFVCLVAGDGEDRKWLSSYLRKHRLTKNVWMMGTVSNKRMQEFLAASDIFFLPSKMEGIAVTIYEAMAMGVVPVSADVGGQRELVTSECGVLIKRGKEQEEVMAYTDVLERLIKSPELRDSMGKAARDRVCSHFKIEQLGERMDSLLERSRQLHLSRPKAGVGLGLGLEHAVQAIEYERVFQAAGGLWKYQRVESALWRLYQLISPWVVRLNGLVSYLLRPVRRAKDAVWIVGHRFKARVFSLEEPG